VSKSEKNWWRPKPQVIQDAYQYLLLELLLDVMVDIRDILDDRLAAD